MQGESANRLARRGKWIKKSWPDLTLLLVVIAMLGWIVFIARSDWTDKPTWLLVPLTVIYALFTLWMAAAAFQNATAARRSAEAMEASVQEQRLARWAAFGAILTFPHGYAYCVDERGSTSVTLGNPFRQPILQLTVRLWEMEDPSIGPGQVRYSTMKESGSRDIEADDSKVDIHLHPTTESEAERVRLATLALERYMALTDGIAPISALCLITYSHRAQLEQAVLVHDLTRATYPKIF